MPPLLATMAAKIGAVLTVIVLLVGLGLYGGCAIKQRAWDAAEKNRAEALATQAMQSADSVIAQGQNTAKVIVKYIERKGAVDSHAEAKAAALKKELDAYVQTHPPCPVPESVVRMFDAPAAADGVPPAADSTGGTADPGEALTLAGVLQALEDAHALYQELADRNSALIEWVRSSYQLQVHGSGR